MVMVDITISSFASLASAFKFPLTSIQKAPLTTSSCLFFFLAFILHPLAFMFILHPLAFM
jgi:hypothetical protein